MPDTPTPAASAEDTWLTMPEVLRAHADGCDSVADKPRTSIKRSLAAIEEGVRLRTLANELDALREAVKGCGQFVGSSGRFPFNCGQRTGCAIRLCGKCEIERDAAIRNLTFTTDGTDG